MSGRVRGRALPILLAVALTSVSGGGTASPARSREAPLPRAMVFRLEGMPAAPAIICPHDAVLRPTEEIRLLHRITGVVDTTTLVTLLSVVGERGWPQYVRRDTITINAGSGLGFELLQYVPATAATGSNRVRFYCEFLDAPVAADSCSYTIIVPPMIAPVSAVATPGSVRLVWLVLDPAVRNAAVYRQLEGDSWTRLATLTADPDRLLTFEDRLVLPERHYRYRLGFDLAGAEIFRGDTAVVVPRAYRLDLAGATPNPSGHAPGIVFEVPSASPATIEMFDADGRRVFARSESWPAGVNRIEISDGRRIPAGVYLVRLSHEGRAITRRAVVR